MDVLWLNGEYINKDQAKISVSDRGFRFGDGVFETILVKYGKPYLFKEHTSRLESGVSALMIDYKVNHDSLFEISAKLISENKIEDGILRIIVTRGSGSRGYMPMPKNDDSPSCLVEVSHLPEMKFAKENILYKSSFSKPSSSSLPTSYKTMQGLNSTLAKIEARDKGFFEALQFSDKGYISECSSYNIFWMRRNILYTPSKETGCVEGITRNKIINMVPYRVVEGKFKLKSLLKADAVFLSNSLALVVPVHGIEGFKVKWKASDHLANLIKMSFEQDIEKSLNLGD